MRVKGNKAILKITIDKDIYVFIKEHSLKISPVINSFLKEYIKKFNSIHYSKIKEAVIEAIEEKEMKRMGAAIEKTKEIYELTGQIPAARYNFLYEQFGLTREEVDKLVINKIIRGR
ncbi:MAG: hypothetical protein H5T45_01440 [Thermoplasmatales archaeon]|nr:hypothetical protein [Thermoplasmatales archaeon]